MEAGGGAHGEENESRPAIPSPDFSDVNREGFPGPGSFFSMTETLPKVASAPEPEEIP